MPQPELPAFFSSLPPLPVDSILPRALSLLERHNRLIIEAAPGAGKTTRVPLALLGSPQFGGKRIIMLEPRRLAARAAARHMSRLLGENPGGTIGYITAHDRKISGKTRVFVVTEGILARMIQDDPELNGADCVIFDEFHERSLNADLGLALCLDCQNSLRPDLRLIIMSATLDSEALSALLQNCPRLEVEGREFPVRVRYLPPARPGLSCEERVASAAFQALRDESGSILAFLPGTAEIRRARERLEAALSSPAARDFAAGARVYPLYGDLSGEEQDAAVSPPPPGQRKVVLSTNIAESSLTIEGVSIVIDSGLERRMEVEPNFGLNRLVTGPISRASSNQRCGRAGRTGPGLCLRLWAEQEQAALRPQGKPEILTADLASLCLEVAVWGLPVGETPTRSLQWLDPPPPEAWRQARSLLMGLEAIDANGKATRRGLAMSSLPLHPRLAHMVLEGKEHGFGPMACVLAALVSERDPAPSVGTDIRHRLGLIADKKDGQALRRIREQMRLIAARSGIDLKERAGRSHDLDAQPGFLAALAWPDRIAMRRAPGSYLMANGRGAALPEGDPLRAHEFLAVAALDAGSGDARIHLAAPLPRELLENAFGRRIREENRITWDRERQAVSARALRRLDALTLSETPLPDPDPEQVKAAFLQGLAETPLSALPWTNELLAWRGRVMFVRRAVAEGEYGNAAEAAEWPDLSDEALERGLEHWLGPYLGGLSRLSAITQDLLDQALRALLPRPLARRLETLAPERLTVPSGSSVALDYSDENNGPVLAVKLQEMFGLSATPALLEGRFPVLLHLLSPAGRPVQVTRDLAGFWQNAYPAVRAELRGRYPKHPWPENPLNSVPTRHTKNRQAQLENQNRK